MRRLLNLTVVAIIVTAGVIVACQLFQYCHRLGFAVSTGGATMTEITPGNITVLQAETFDLQLRQVLESLVRYEVRYRGNLAKSGQRTSHVLAACANSWQIGGRPKNDEPQDVPLYAFIDLIGITTNADGGLTYTVRVEVPNTRTQDEVQKLLAAVKKLGTVLYK